MSGTKRILQDYIDACELIRETEEDIKRLRKKQKVITQDSVKGSNPEYPYNEKHFKIQGSSFTYHDDARLRREEKILEERKEHAEQIRVKAQAVMNLAPARIQRIIRFKYFKKLSWEQVAIRIGGDASGDSVRKELERYLQKK